MNEAQTEAQEILAELIENYEVRVETIASRVGCSFDTVQRWRRGAKPMAMYLKRLNSLRKRVVGKAENNAT